MNDMVPALDDLKRKRIFNDEEIRQIVKKRRADEYTMLKPDIKLHEYLSVVRYEVALECLRERRRKELNWRRKTVSDFAGVTRLHRIFSKATFRFRGDIKMWYQYLDFCLRSGSTKVLSSVVVRALKFHPRKVPLWLLAADRELKVANIGAARSLLVRGLRFGGSSPWLWAQFLRLEVRVALHVNQTRDSEEGAPAAASCWAPAQLLFRKALKELKGNAASLAIFLKQVQQSLKEAKSEATENARAVKGLAAWEEEIAEVLRSSRPDAPGGLDMEDVEEEDCNSLWSLWWEFERSTKSWKELSDEVASQAPACAMVHFSERLLQALRTEEAADQDATLKVLLEFSDAPRLLSPIASSPSSSSSSSSANASPSAAAEGVLKTLEVASDMCKGISSSLKSADQRGIEKAHKSLAERAAAAFPESGAIALVLWGVESQASPSSSSTAVPSVRKTSLNSATGAAFAALQASSNGTLDPALFEATLRALEDEKGVEAVVTAALSSSLALGGEAPFKEARRLGRAVADKLWDLPKRRAALLAALLESELRCRNLQTLGIGVQKKQRLLREDFEALLACLADDDEAREAWWLRYMRYVDQVSKERGGALSGLPTVMDLHWRAMRSVADQASYQEKAQELLQQHASI